jgi:hypothetical protein
MDFQASHTGFVIAAYLLSGGVLAGLVVGNYLILRARQRALARLEGQGAPRRRRPT